MLSAEIDKHAALTISVAGPFVCTNNAHAHTYIVVDSLPCDEILRAGFTGTIYLKVWRHFEGSDNSRCREISRKYGIYNANLSYQHLIYYNN